MTYHLTDGIDFMKKLPYDSVDGIFTDPPWGSGPAIIGQENYLELIKDMTFEASRVLKQEGLCVIWVGMCMLGKIIKAIDDIEYKFTVFCDYTPSRYVSIFESRLDPILIYQRKDGVYPKFDYRIKQLYQIVSTGKSDTRHPCARPFKSVYELLGCFFKQHDYVIDPFAGSNTVGVACDRLNFKWDTCEIDPKMYQTGLE